jgi:hypothetical protein
LLLKDLDLGKADASAEKAEAAPIVEVLKSVTKRPDNHQRRERWPKELMVELFQAVRSHNIERGETKLRGYRGVGFKVQGKDPTSARK